jgi:hypothetical protein
MSSVTRFIRQIPAEASHLSAAAIAAAPASMIYELVPSASNIVGNYGPGYVQLASAALILAVQEAVNAAGAASNLILRDMGKTILAPVGSLSGNQGFFRHVQLLRPQALSASQGFNGGSSGSSFGVLGAAGVPDAYTDFMSFYIPVSVAGVNYGPIAINAYPIAGGQM